MNHFLAQFSRSGRFLRLSAIGVACIAINAASVLAQAASPLRIGEAFPPLAAEAVSGRAIEIPTSVAARPTAVIFGFSKQAGKDAQHWDELLAPDRATGGIDVVVVAEIQSVPRLIRGAVALAIRRGVAANLRDRMILLDRDEKIWKARFAVTGTDQAYVALLDSAGKVSWLSDGQRADESISRLRDAMHRPARD